VTKEKKKYLCTANNKSGRNHVISQKLEVPIARGRQEDSFRPLRQSQPLGCLLRARWNLRSQKARNNATAALVSNSYCRGQLSYNLYTLIQEKFIHFTTCHYSLHSQFKSYVLCVLAFYGGKVIWISIILPFALYGCGTWSLTLME